MPSSLIAGLVTALSLLVVDLIIPGVHIDTFTAALLAALSIGIVNTLVKPVLAILSLPLTILSLGLFALVVNGICFWLASVIVPGFRIDGFFGFILGPIGLSLVSTGLSHILRDKSSEIQEAG